MILALRIQPACARAEDDLGDKTKIGVFTIKQPERIPGVIDIDRHDLHVGDMLDHINAAIVVHVGETCQISGAVPASNHHRWRCTYDSVIVFGSAGRTRAGESVMKDRLSIWGFALISSSPKSADPGLGFTRSGPG